MTSTLRLALIELRYPLVPSLANMDALQALSNLLQPQLPIVRSGVGAPPSISIGPGQMAVSQSGFTFMSRDLFSSATVLPTTTIVQTTSYGEWSRFLGLFRTVLQAVNTHSPLQGVERLGIRLINEVRLDGDPPGLDPWTRVIASEALAPHLLARILTDRDVKQGLVQTVLSKGEATTLTLRHGLLEGFAVSDAPLKLPTPLAKGPYYLVDIDHSTTMPAPLPEFSEAGVLGLATDLHSPTKAILEGIIKPGIRAAASIDGGK